MTVGEDKMTGSEQQCPVSHVGDNGKYVFQFDLKFSLRDACECATLPTQVDMEKEG